MARERTKKEAAAASSQPDVFDEQIPLRHAEAAAAASAPAAPADPQPTPADPGPTACQAAAERQRHTGPGRPWTQRYEHPVKYRRFTARDGSGKEKIMFRFELAPGQDRPPQELIDVLHQHQKTDQGYPTYLRFESDPVVGKVWKLPNTELGRATADSLDQALNTLACKLANGPGVTA
jgi:hypothetical protein